MKPVGDEFKTSLRNYIILGRELLDIAGLEGCRGREHQWAKNGIRQIFRQQVHKITLKGTGKLCDLTSQSSKGES